MSDFLAIAAITTTLRNLLAQVAVQANLPDAMVLPDTTVTTRPPHKARSDRTTGNQLNLFLYRLAPDTAWRRRGGGAKPGTENLSAVKPVALNLYYLITAYGQNDDDILAHQLIGWVISYFNEYPELNREVMQQNYSGHFLTQQTDKIGVNPYPLSQEELSKLWSAFGRDVCGPTVAYQVSPVLIGGSSVPASTLQRGPGSTVLAQEVSLP
jgi:hypothetical protein